MFATKEVPTDEVPTAQGLLDMVLDEYIVNTTFDGAIDEWQYATIAFWAGRVI